MFGQLFHFRDLLKELIKMSLSEALQEERHILKEVVQEVLIENGLVVQQKPIQGQANTNPQANGQGTSIPIPQKSGNNPSVPGDKDGGE